MIRAPSAAGIVVTSALVVCAGCNNTRDINYVGGGTTGPGGTTVGGGSGAGSGDGGPGAPSGNFFKADARYDAPPGTVLTTPGADATCAAQTIKAERLPLDLYFMMDASGSMLEKTAAGATKWDAVRAAMSSFLGDPQSAGLGVGLQYFPLLQPGVPADCTTDPPCGQYGPCDRLRTCYPAMKVTPCDTNAQCMKNQQCVLVGLCALQPNLACPATPGTLCSNNRNDVCQQIAGYCHGRDVCDVAAYAKPAVAVAPLPGAAAAMMASLSQKQPDGLTPTAPALSGAIQQALALEKANAGHRVAVVLATDGLPVSCMPTDINAIGMIADTANRGTPRVPTFVIGVFAQDEQMLASMNLNTLAQKGGTGQAFVINTGQNVTQQFVAALNSIRTTALACEYKIPAAMNAAQVDYGKVNVQFTSGAGQASVIGYAKDKASCNPTTGGWYYDVDPSTGGKPTTIIACDATCSKLKADANGRVDIVIGCKTVLIE
jgi:hypothetical protein